VNNEFDLIEATIKLNGAILRKAEFENNFDGVYTKVFEKMVELEVLGAEDVLEIFGDMGG
jgi:hypothetical protein